MEISTTLIWKSKDLSSLESFYADKKWEAKSLLDSFYITRDKDDVNDFRINVPFLSYVISSNTLEDAKRMAQEYYDTRLKQQAEQYHQ
jgi:hypothetical protein|uniref:Uncharacterized protein n=1 Tax=Podoviridae sp. ctz6O13 TaxID=2827757 RepID=A0A8S5TL65_9CAUD|nr:MAG TPA: hypothetical protein [Podoviridae sp. ctz6O13]